MENIMNRVSNITMSTQVLHENLILIFTISTYMGLEENNKGKLKSKGFLYTWVGSCIITLIDFPQTTAALPFISHDRRDKIKKKKGPSTEHKISRKLI